jgi:tRNA/rRNA methyltransferase
MTPKLKIILVRPRNPDNIGAAARAMANFGLSDLALVAPFDSDWQEAVNVWRREASVSAIDAMDVVNSARIYGSIPEAAEDCSLLLGTSSLHRLKPGRDVMLLSETPAYISRARGKTGILFGSEKTGLTKDELSFCRAMINIPTREKQPSMNLGQSVAVLAYELAARGRGLKPPAQREKIEANPMEIERAVGQICARLQRDSGPHWGGEAQVRAIRQGLLDARLTKAAMNALNLLLKQG